ncbi:DUF962 domain-containing protein [Daejeonella oryzae]|uniref:DUF962 domain-containing protein n=1 Tax=Daejeonella oryzae TaxID=1122943 RepID=UPI0004290DEA|nr:DUF962 domain-containing protein [Daejeonella oryzae]
MEQKRYTSLKQFYPFYLDQHRNSRSRILHFIGTGLVILLIPASLLLNKLWLLLLIPFVGYGFAWMGHYFFEKNKPATFQYPGYSLASDFILFWDLLRGKQKF